MTLQVETDDAQQRNQPDHVSLVRALDDIINALDSLLQDESPPSWAKRIHKIAEGARTILLRSSLTTPRSPHTIEIEQRLISGESVADIARDLGNITRQRVDQIAKRIGIRGHRKSRRQLEKEKTRDIARTAARSAILERREARQCRKRKMVDEALAMRDAGKTWVEIGDAMGITPTLIHRWVLELHPDRRMKKPHKRPKRSKRQEIEEERAARFH